MNMTARTRLGAAAVVAIFTITLLASGQSVEGT
jgi:hypothetical protein